MALGKDLAGGTSDKAELPTRTQNTSITGEPTKSPTMDSMKKLMQNPQMLAFLTNAAMGLLTSQGIGPSFAQGLAGVGRYKATEWGQNMEMAKLALSASGKAKGSGGSGGDTAGPSGKGFKETPAFWKAVDSRTKDLMDASDGDMTYGDARSEAIMMVMSEFGDPSAYQTYLSADDNGKAALRTMFATGANSGKQALTQSMKDYEAEQKNAAKTAEAGAKAAEQTGGGASIAPPAIGGMDIIPPALPQIGGPLIGRRAPSLPDTSVVPQLPGSFANPVMGGGGVAAPTGGMGGGGKPLDPVAQNQLLQLLMGGTLN